MKVIGTDEAVAIDAEKDRKIVVGESDPQRLTFSAEARDRFARRAHGGQSASVQNDTSSACLLPLSASARYTILASTSAASRR